MPGNELEQRKYDADGRCCRRGGNRNSVYMPYKRRVMFVLLGWGFSQLSGLATTTLNTK